MELLDLTNYEGYSEFDLKALVAEDRALRNLLGGLLAVLHGDGGHYQSEHGTEKAVEDAKAKYYRKLKQWDKETYDLRKKLEYYKLLHTLRKKAKLALNLRICGLRDQLRDEKAKSKDYEHNWHLTCTEVKALRAENEKLKNEHEINLKDWNWHLSEFATEIADLRTENAEWKRAHDEHDCTATVDVGGEIERLKAEVARLEKNSRCVPPHIYKIGVENGELKAEALLSQSVIASLRAKLEKARGLMKESPLMSGETNYQQAIYQDWLAELAALLSDLDPAPDTPFDNLMDKLAESRKEVDKDDSTWSDPLNTGEGIPQVKIVEEKDEPR